MVDNALKYSPVDSTIDISLRAKNDATITIRNSGTPISPHDLPYIFDRFYRADSSRHSNGHGLGLSLAKQIVDHHHGSIRATSTSAYTTFIVTLPGVKKSEK